MSGGKDCNKTRICQDYVLGLEKERCKIQVFERELPLCLQLVTKAIETCKQQLPLSGPTCEYNFLSQWEFSDQTISSETEKFNSLKRGVSEKSEWLRSAHLWNQNSDPPEKPKIAAPTPVSSSPETGAGKKRHHKERETQRKIRRNWSLELHQRFLHALEHLGGSHLATPKQIKELMKEDGLSSDEIKSHLQKYRLHTTKPPPAATTIAVTGGRRRNLGATGHHSKKFVII